MVRNSDKDDTVKSRQQTNVKSVSATRTVISLGHMEKGPYVLAASSPRSACASRSMASVPSTWHAARTTCQTTEADSKEMCSPLGKWHYPSAAPHHKAATKRKEGRDDKVITMRPKCIKAAYFKMARHYTSKKSCA